jgi:hypothetical protein
LDDTDDPYREFNAEAVAYQEEVKRLEQERRLASFLQMLTAMAGEDLPPQDDCSKAPVDYEHALTSRDEPSAGTHKRWAVFEDRHPRLKAIPVQERLELAKRAYPGESWSELLYRLNAPKTPRSKR